MKKSLLLGITGIILIALTATTLYAQTVAGTSLADKMKAAVADFTLSAVLNPGETGLKSAPIAGKKTGGILTAGEWNRVLELLGQGGGGSGWVDVPLSDQAVFDKSCEYRFTSTQPNPYKGTNPWTYATAVSPESLVYILHNSLVSHINNTSKTIYRLNGADAGWVITAIEKLCGGGGASTGGGVEIVEGGLIKTSAKTISNWDLITLEGSWNSGGGDAAPTGGYIYKLNGQPKLSYVEASGISKDVTLTTTAQTVHNLSVRLSGDSVIIDPSSTNTLAYIVWKFGGGSSTGTSSSTGIGTPDYQSDWIDFGLAGNPVKKKFTHNLGTENYMIQMEGKGPGGDNNNCPSFIGADSSNSWLMNSGYWYYYDKNSNSVSVANYTNSLGRCSRYIRIKLWKHGAPVIAPASTVTNL